MPSIYVQPDDKTVQDTNIVVVPIAHNESVHKAHIVESIEQLVSGEFLGESEKEKDIQNDAINFWVMKAASDFGYQIQQENVGVKVIDAVKKAVINPVVSQKQRAQLHTQAFRVAINTLLPTAGKKVILFIGGVPELNALQSQNWNQMIEVARHNAISLVWVYVKSAAQENSDVQVLNQGLVAFQNCEQNSRIHIGLWEVAMSTPSTHAFCKAAFHKAAFFKAVAVPFSRQLLCLFQGSC